jgi:oligoendopeptidase F
MTQTRLPKRNEVDPQLTFDLEALYPSVGEWSATFQVLEQDLPALVKFEGRLGESGCALLEFLTLNANYEIKLNRLWLYAYLRTEADSGDGEAQDLLAQVQDLINRASAATAWERTELLEISPERLKLFFLEEPNLEVWAGHIDNLQRQRSHLRSLEVEALLGQVERAMAGVNNQYATLQRELRYDPIHNESGNPVEVTLANIGKLNASADRNVRREVDQSETRAYTRHQDSFAALLSSEINRRVLIARARNHASSLDHALFEAGLSKQVFDTTIQAFNRNRFVWHRYWEIKRRAFGVKKLETCDFGLRLAGHVPEIPYSDAARWVSEAMRPLGDDYVNILRQGLTLERWVDVMPSEGKSFREYSMTVNGAKPYILIWYASDVRSVSTLAHESGHSMHSLYTFRTQPHQYGGYGVTAAEVAANTHQALLTAHLLKTQADPKFQLAVLEEELDTFVRYLFRMPLRAQFEAELHSAVERGEAFTAERLTERFTELCAEAYGPAVQFTLEDGLAWTQAIVLYQHFSSFQYMLGLAGGQAIAQQLLKGEPGAVEGYLKFISAGKSQGQLEVLKFAGVDFTDSNCLDRAFVRLEELIDRLEEVLTSNTV